LKQHHQDIKTFDFKYCPYHDIIEKPKDLMVLDTLAEKGGEHRVFFLLVFSAFSAPLR
jgi:hypothetical protein